MMGFRLLFVLAVAAATFLACQLVAAVDDGAADAEDDTARKYRLLSSASKRLEVGGRILNAGRPADAYQHFARALNDLRACNLPECARLRWRAAMDAGRSAETLAQTAQVVGAQVDGAKEGEVASLVQQVANTYQMALSLASADNNIGNAAVSMLHLCPMMSMAAPKCKRESLASGLNRGVCLECEQLEFIRGTNAALQEHRHDRPSRPGHLAPALAKRVGEVLATTRARLGCPAQLDPAVSFAPSHPGFVNDSLAYMQPVEGMYAAMRQRPLHTSAVTVAALKRLMGAAPLSDAGAKGAVTLMAASFDYLAGEPRQLGQLGVSLQFLIHRDVRLSEHFFRAQQFLALVEAHAVLAAAATTAATTTNNGTEEEAAAEEVAAAARDGGAGVAGPLCAEGLQAVGVDEYVWDTPSWRAWLAGARRRLGRGGVAVASPPAHIPRGSRVAADDGAEALVCERNSTHRGCAYGVRVHGFWAAQHRPRRVPLAADGGDGIDIYGDTLPGGYHDVSAGDDLTLTWHTWEGQVHVSYFPDAFVMGSNGVVWTLPTNADGSNGGSDGDGDGGSGGGGDGRDGDADALCRDGVIAGEGAETPRGVDHEEDERGAGEGGSESSSHEKEEEEEEEEEEEKEEEEEGETEVNFEELFEVAPVNTDGDSDGGDDGPCRGPLDDDEEYEEVWDGEYDAGDGPAVSAHSLPWSSSSPPASSSSPTFVPIPAGPSHKVAAAAAARDQRLCRVFTGAHFFHNPFWQDVGAIGSCAAPPAATATAAASGNGAIQPQPGEYAHFMQCCLHNYGHFLTEAVPRLVTLVDVLGLGRLREMTLIYPVGLSFQRHMDFVLDALDLVPLPAGGGRCSAHGQRTLPWDRAERAAGCARFERVYYADWVPAKNEQLPRYPGGTSTERHFAPGSVLARTRQVLVENMWWNRRHVAPPHVLRRAGAGSGGGGAADAYAEFTASSAVLRGLRSRDPNAASLSTYCFVVYVSRGSASARAVDQEDKLTGRLAAWLRRRRPECRLHVHDGTAAEATLDRTAWYFQHAIAVVGAYGAALNDVLFARATTRLFLLPVLPHVDFYYENLAAALGLEVVHVPGLVATQNGRYWLTDAALAQLDGLLTEFVGTGSPPFRQ